MGQPISSVRDDFFDNVEGDLWSASAASGSATKAETGGEARFTLPSSTAGTHIAYYRTPTAYDLTALRWYINIDTMVATGVAATAFFDLFLDGNNILRWRQLSNAITARTIVNGVETQQFTATWNAATYKYLGIFNSGANILFQSSTDGISWTTRATVAVSALFPVTDLYIQFGASCGNIASPGSFRVEDVNLILPALATGWNWTEAIWSLTNRHRTITMAIDTPGTGQGYVLTADGVDASDAPSGNLRYWSGPMHDGRQLTLCASQAQAEAMAVNIPADGRVDLPEMIEARCFKVYHRSIDGSAYTIRELFPRRLLQGDDVETETLTALHIRASTITGDKISATFTITGRRIQTGTSLARVVLSGEANGGFIGYSNTDTYDPVTGTGTYQVLWKLTDGILYAGAGALRLDANGMKIDATAVDSAIGWWSADYATTLYCHIGGSSGANGFLRVRAGEIFASAMLIDMYQDDSGFGGLGHIDINAQGSTSVIRMMIDTDAELTVVDGGVTVDGGLNVGTATGAATGQIKTSAGITTVGTLSSTGANAGVMFEDRTGAADWQWYGTGNVARLYTGTVDAIQIGTSGSYNIMNGGAFFVASTQVVGARKTGWTAATGTAQRGTFATDTVTLINLARAFKALQDDLISHGLIGS